MIGWVGPTGPRGQCAHVCGTGRRAPLGSAWAEAGRGGEEGVGPREGEAQETESLIRARAGDARFGPRKPNAGARLLPHFFWFSLPIFSFFPSLFYDYFFNL